MSNIMVDIEADGPVPGLYSMVSFGAVIVEPSLTKTFYGQCRPISQEWIPEALAVSGHTREECLEFDNPYNVMVKFADWIKENGVGNRQIFWADNNGFDFAFINYYFHLYKIPNPFGWSSQNLNSFYKGCTRDMYTTFKKLRKTKHTHHPVDDAKGNAEALLEIKKIHNVNIQLR